MKKDTEWLLEEKYAGEKTEAFLKDTERLAKGEPLAYVIGWQPFLKLKIYLDSRPLIPRAETEWWTEQLLLSIIRDCSSAKFSFLDLCAGSGAIGCAILNKIQNAQVYFGEIEYSHKSIILKNIRENNLDAKRASIRIGDLFEPFENMRFDRIAINPPYIPNERILPKSVALYEDERALYSGKDGLDVIRRVANDLSKYLAPNGQAWIECDSAAATAVATLFKEKEFLSEIRNDQYDIPRLVVVSFK